MKYLALIFVLLLNLSYGNLTTEEKEYLEKNNTFTVCDQFNHYPISGHRDGKIIGIMGDIYDLISQKLNITFEAIEVNSYEDLDQKVNSGQCDLVSIITKGQKRFPDMQTSHTIHSVYFASIGNLQSVFLDDEADLSQYTFYVRFNSFLKVFKKFYPSLNVVFEPDTNIIMNKVLQDKTNIYIDINSIIDYQIQKYGFDQYKLNGIFDKINLEGAIGVNKKHPILLEIINKSLDHIGQTKIEQIIQKYQIKEFQITTNNNIYLLWGIIVLVILLVVLLYISSIKHKAASKTLLEKQKYEFLLKNSTDGIHIVSFDGKLIDCSDTFAQMLGYTKDEILKLDVRDWDNKQTADENHMNSIQKNNESRFQSQFTKKDGTNIDVEVLIKQIEFSGQKYFYASARDITENLAKEKALKENEFRWKFAVEGSGDGLWDWNLETNEVFFSTQWKKMLGFEEDEIQGSLEEWEKRVHPDQIQQCYHDIQDHLEGKTISYINQHQVLCKDGTYKWILDRGIVVDRDDNGNPLRMIGTHTDIDVIIKLKDELETIFKYTRDGLAVIDNESKLLNCNDAFANLLGYTKKELLTMSCQDLTPTDDQMICENAIQQALEKGYIENIEKRCLHKDGKMFPVTMDIAMLPSQNRFLISIKDLTTIKSMEEQAKLASMGEMIGNIAHQWRQPLAVITANVSELKITQEFDGKVSETLVNEITDSVIRQANYLSHTIDNFRDFIKGNTLYENISIKKAINSSINLITASLNSNYITLIQDTEDDLRVYGNVNELEQAFINILNNAKDALKDNISNEEDRFVFITTKKINENQLKLLIKDTGGGIPLNIMDRIFEPYFTTKHQSRGTGLGLVMVDKILRERHEATIDVYNEKFIYNDKRYEGACFQIIFTNKEKPTTK